MKQSIKHQFYALMEGLGWENQDEMVEGKTCADFKRMGEDFKRLASIGWQTCQQIKEQQERANNDTIPGAN